MNDNLNHMDTAYPNTMPDRLYWFESVLKISKKNLLQMMMLDSEEITSFMAANWHEIFNSRPTACQRVEELIVYVINIHYDWNYYRMANDKYKTDAILHEMKKTPWWNDAMWNWYWRWFS